MHLREDSEKHLDLIQELIDIFLQRHFTILGAVPGLGYPRAVRLSNDGYGDQEDKEPDIYAYDEGRARYIIGEAKTGEGDLETEHALTQYNVYLDQVHARNQERAEVYIIVPEKSVPEFSSLITHYIHREYWGNIVVVRSKRW
jgi:hypothetical protein